MSSNPSGNQPRPGTTRSHTPFGRSSLILPVGILALTILCSVLYLSSSQFSLIPAQSAEQDTAIKLSAAYPMLQRSPVISNVLYFVGQNTDGMTDIFRLTVNPSPTLTLTSTPENITESAGRSEYWPVPSPDGTRLAYYEKEGTAKRLIILPLGSGRIDVSAPSAVTGLNIDYQISLEQPPVWSPDGHWLAFVAQQIPDRGNASELFVARADGTELRRLSQNGNRVSFPTWLDTHYLVYSETRTDENVTFYRVDVETSLEPEKLTNEVKIPRN